MEILRKKYKTIILFILFLIAFIALSARKTYNVTLDTALWSVKSIDTMKYSRDYAREKLNDISFDTVIDKQISDIASTGANYVAIGTPYDEEFYPILARWVDSARRHHLRVWFRGNLAGWEGWFNYPKIDAKTHTKTIRTFILSHKDLFADGDIFSSCPECENGGLGDPRKTGNVSEYRKFLIDEYQTTKDAFSKINKRIIANYDSMNYDVASLIMDSETTKKLGGVVVIDHYIDDPKRYITDIERLAQKSRGDIVIGEFGAPIPDLNGKMTQQQQAAWISQVLESLISSKDVIGVNYWTNVGSSTELWSSSDGSARQAVSVVKHFFTYKPPFGLVENSTREPLEGVTISSPDGRIYTTSNKDGVFVLPYLLRPTTIELTKDGYKRKEEVVVNREEPYIITLEKKNPSFFYILKDVFTR